MVGQHFILPRKLLLLAKSRRFSLEVLKRS